MVSVWSASTPERGHLANYPHVVPQVSASSTDQDRTPKAGVGSSNLPRRTEVFLQVKARIAVAVATRIVSALSGTGQHVVGASSQDVDGLSGTWTDVGGRRVGRVRTARRLRGLIGVHDVRGHIYSGAATVVSMDVTVPEAARLMGVSVARARQLAAQGRLRARLVGGRWLVDAASLPSAPRRSRPMRPRGAGAFLVLSDGRRPDWIEPRESYRLRRSLDRLAADEPELVLRSWLASRGDRRELSAQDPQALRSDARVVLSGLSDGRAGLSAAANVEGYVLADDAEAVIRDHLLIDARPRADVVVLHVSPLLPEAPVPLLLVAADLADHDGPRELARARDLIREWAGLRQGEDE